MDLIQEINLKYQPLEAEVERKLEKIKREEERLGKLEECNTDKSSSSEATKVLSYEEAMTRNANLLKSVEMAKARLRSRSTFSPVEQILKKAIENYKRDLDAAAQGCVEQTLDSSRTIDTENLYEFIDEK